MMNIIKRSGIADISNYIIKFIKLLNYVIAAVRITFTDGQDHRDGRIHASRRWWLKLVQGSLGRAEVELAQGQGLNE